MSATKNENAQHELTITRVFNAPRALVWQAWTEADHAKQWAGPRGFIATNLDHDIRPGGKWRGCLHHEPAADHPALDLWQSGEYLEVVEPERLVYSFRWDKRGNGLSSPETIITVTFKEHDGQTTMHFHQAFFETAEDRDGHNGGWNSSFDRLVDHLQAVQSKQTTHA